MVERLGLEQQGAAFVTHADELRDERPLAGPVTVRIGNRAMVTHCVVGPPLSEPLIGQVVLETLDLIADCTNRTPTPLYPDYPLLKRDHGNAPTAHLCAVVADTPIMGVKHRGRSWSRIADRDVGHLPDGMPAW